MTSRELFCVSPQKKVSLIALGRVADPCGLRHSCANGVALCVEPRKAGPFKAEQCPGHEPSREWLLEIYGDHRRKICVFLIFE